MWIAMHALVLFCWLPTILRLAVSFGLGAMMFGFERSSVPPSLNSANVQLIFSALRDEWRYEVIGAFIADC
jgi:hypothetical protein